MLLAGYLQKTGATLELVDHSPERAHVLSKGIRWEGMNTDFTFQVPVTVGLRVPEDKDLVIVCVKAYDTESVVRDLSAAGYRGPVMTLQNGVENADIIARGLPASPLIAGVTSEGANLVSASHLRHAGRGKTSFGALSEGKPAGAFLAEVVALFRAAGLDAELSGEPQSLIWGKVLVNAGINALTAVLGVRNGRLLEIEPARRLMSELVLEAWEVIQRKNLSPGYSDPVARVEEVCRQTAENFSSMYADIKKGRRTEIDSINGAIVREGARVNVPCPRNHALAELVRALERLGSFNAL